VREACNFTVLLGMRGQAQLNRIGSRCTGKERDAESGNDYFGARYYASTMGRFMSPDWAAKLEGSNPVPYANLEYPQTLNLYSYAGNNPLSRTDPDGHCTNGGKQQGFW
jgi:RHS repeat-associated protein